ncbi:MAG TPA: hypothetical protein VH301_09595, partial [Usitatibacter sp.]|nr:hypothetical protein [Usitatibacter sp.]
MRTVSIAAATLLAAACAGAERAPDVGGTRPTYLDAVTAQVPNMDALGRRIWTPALDEGFVPQGLTFADGALLVSSYHPMPELKSNTGPCTVFRIDIASGTITGRF